METTDLVSRGKRGQYVLRIILSIQFVVLLIECIMYFVQGPYISISPTVPVIFTDAATRLIMFLLSAFFLYEIVSANRMAIVAGAATMVVLAVLYPVPEYMLLTLLSLITLVILWKNKRDDAPHRQRGR